MADLAKNLATKCNHWAVAITTSYFDSEDCENLIDCWDLASVEHANQIDTDFSFKMAQIAEVLHSGLQFRPYQIILIGAKSAETAGLDKMLWSLKYENTILNLFWLDSSVEAKIRTVGLAVGRLQRISRDIANVMKLAGYHEKHAKKNLARTSLFDATACQQQLASANSELAELRKHILSFINPVLIF